jgi:CubicO group peptidase (beta-lactamase class C family)
MPATVRTTAFLCLLTIGLTTCGQAPGHAPQALAGLWGVELDLGPLVRGPLTLDGRGAQWRAQIAGFDVPVDRKDAAVSFTLPGDAGEFRGHLSADGKTIVGQWIQPKAAALFSRYATPLELAPTAPHVWRGQVVPNPARISFYVSIQRAADGSLSAFIRNPEFGWLQRGAFAVTVNGSAVTFTNTQRRGQQFSGSYDAQGDRLTLQLIDGAPPVALTRRTRDTAPGFFPRALSAGYVYRPPIAEDDGWATASLADVGLDPAPISALIGRILGADPAANPLNVQSLLIARHGKLVLEEYFYGFDAERPHDMRSAGKTFAPVLVGLARDHGAQVSPETPVYSLFPEYKPFAHWDERKQRMRLQDLMSMTAGYDCDEDHSDDAPLNEDVMQEQTAQPDWYKYALDAPMAHDPGGDRAYYCSPELNLVGGVAAKVSGSRLPELFYDDFARPLQFHTYHLNLQPTGEAYMGGGAYIRPRDQLKLGQLYLAGGMWNGRRVIRQDWVEQSLAVHARFEDRFGVDHLYGWGWHIHHLKVDGHVYTEYEAGGNGGQLVLILPELDLVIGFSGGAYGDFQNWGKWGPQVVPQYIIPAAHPGR